MPLRLFIDPSDWPIIVEMITIFLCFILVIISIWFAMGTSLFPAIFSMIGAFFIIKALRAIKGIL